MNTEWKKRQGNCFAGVINEYTTKEAAKAACAADNTCYAFGQHGESSFKTKKGCCHIEGAESWCNDDCSIPYSQQLDISTTVGCNTEQQVDYTWFKPFPHITTPQKAHVRCCPEKESSSAGCISVALSGDPNSTMHTFDDAKKMCSGEMVNGKTPVAANATGGGDVLSGKYRLPTIAEALGRAYASDEPLKGALGTGRWYNFSHVWVRGNQKRGDAPLAVKACDIGDVGLSPYCSGHPNHQ